MTAQLRASTSPSTPADPADEITRLRRRLDRERRARVEAEALLEQKSGELFDAYERLKAESARAAALASAVEASSDGIALTDEAGCFTYMNDAHASLFGYRPTELAGQPWSVLYAPEVAAWISAEVMPALFAKGSWRGELEGRTRHGDRLQQEVVLSVRSEGGLICATRDIGERLERERQARELEARLFRAEREAALFTVGNAVAHDFNNLIAAISGYALLLQGDLEPDSEAFARAGRILEAADQASDVVRSLELERLNDVRTVDDIDLVRLLRTGLAISDAIRPNGIRLELDLAPEAIVRSNEVLLSRALINIAKNAFEAMGDSGVFGVRLASAARPFFGGRGHAFVLGATSRRPVWVLELRDTGPGIPPDRLESVFTPFSTTKQASRGSGLGLLSLKALADTRTAMVEVETLPGEGTGFRILFLEDETWSDVPDRSPLRPPASDGKARILVVDDNAAVGQMLAETLLRQGYDARWEGDASQALAGLAAGPLSIDVLLTDLTMPAISGDELARKAKALHPALPVVLYSGQAGYVPADPIFAGILTKPIAPEPLRLAIEAAIDGTGIPALSRPSGYDLHPFAAGD